MTSFTRSGRCVACGFRVCDHYLGQRFVSCAQLLDERGDVRFEEAHAGEGYPEVADETLQALRARIAAGLDHGRDLR